MSLYSPQMANNSRDSYYALKTVGIGFNIATIAKNSDFWRLEVKIEGQWPPMEKIQKLSGVIRVERLIPKFQLYGFKTKLRAP